MKKLYLNRFFGDLNNTLGCLEVEGLDYPLYTNEPNWQFNEKNESCIPDGIYLMKPHHSTTHGNCFKIYSVYGRTSVLMHVGNTFKDSEGCILLGLRVGSFQDGEEAVLNSLDAMTLLRKLITNPCELHIRSSYV